MNVKNDSDGLLKIALSAAVPLRILELKKICSYDKIFDRNVLMENEKLLCEKGDMILFRSDKKGENAMMFNVLVDSIARLSFASGGIEIFGMRFESVLDE